jgi:hypothetical protein
MPPKPRKRYPIGLPALGKMLSGSINKEFLSLKANRMTIQQKSSNISVKKIDVPVFIVFEIHFYVLLSTLTVDWLC